MKEWVSAPEAARVLGIDPRTLRKAIDAGDFPGRRFGSRYRVPRSALDGPDETGGVRVPRNPRPTAPMPSVAERYPLHEVGT